MLWHAPCEELCTPTGRCAGVVDTGIKEQKGNIMRTLIPVGHLWKRACLQMTAVQYCAPLCSLKKEGEKKALVRCSSSSSGASSRQRTLRNRHNPTSVRGGEILREDPCPSPQPFPPSPRRALLPWAPSSRGSRPSLLLILALGSGRRRNAPARMERVMNEVGVLLFFFCSWIPLRGRPGCQLEVDSRTNGDQI